MLDMREVKAGLGVVLRLGMITATVVITLGVASCSSGGLEQTAKELTVSNSDAASEDMQAEDSLEMENPGAAETEENSVLQAAVGQEHTIAPRIHMTISSDPQLDLDSKRIVGAHNYDGNPNWWCRDVDEAKRTGRDGLYLALPEYVSSVSPVGKSESCMEGNREDVQMELTYRISDSNYLLHVYSTVPNFGFNKIECSILDAKTKKSTGASPYKCSVAWLQQDWYNPMPKVHLQNK